MELFCIQSIRKYGNISNLDRRDAGNSFILSASFRRTHLFLLSSPLSYTSLYPFGYRCLDPHLDDCAGSEFDFDSGSTVRPRKSRTARQHLLHLRPVDLHRTIDRPRHHCGSVLERGSRYVRRCNRLSQVGRAQSLKDLTLQIRSAQDRSEPRLVEFRQRDLCRHRCASSSSTGANSQSGCYDPLVAESKRDSHSVHCRSSRCQFRLPSASHEVETDFAHLGVQHRLIPVLPQLTPIDSVHSRNQQPGFGFVEATRDAAECIQEPSRYDDSGRADCTGASHPLV